MLTLLNTLIHYLASDRQSCYDQKIQNHRFYSPHAWNFTGISRYDYRWNSDAYNSRQTRWYHPVLMGLLRLLACFHYDCPYLWKAGRSFWAQTNLSVWHNSVFNWFSSFGCIAIDGAVNSVPRHPGIRSRSSFADCTYNNWRYFCT